MIQYIQKFSTVNQKICCSINDDDNLYILNVESNNTNNVFQSSGLFGSNNSCSYIMRVLVAKIINGSFKLIKEYNKFNSDDDIYDLTYMNKSSLFMWKNRKLNVYYFSTQQTQNTLFQ